MRVHEIKVHNQDWDQGRVDDAARHRSCLLESIPCSELSCAKCQARFRICFIISVKSDEAKNDQSTSSSIHRYKVHHEIDFNS